MLEQDDLRSAEMLQESCQQITEQVSRVIVGQQDVVIPQLIGPLADFGAMFPGTAQTIFLDTQEAKVIVAEGCEPGHFDGL